MVMLSRLSEQKAWKAITILSAIGIVLAIYLLYNFYSPTPSTVCNINNQLNCDAVSKGCELALFLGIPVAIIGGAGYVIILIASILKKKKLTLAMAAFGTLFCLRMTILELLVIKVFCPVCLACQLIMLVVFLLSVYLFRIRRKSDF